MGIIKKQSIQSTLYTYLGVGLGFLNTGVLLPLFLSPEKVGLLAFLSSFTNLFASVCTLGIPLITIKVFPKFRSEKDNNHGFFSFVLIMTLIGALIGLLFFFLFENHLFSEKNTAQQFQPFIYGFVILFILRLVFRNFDSLIRMLLNTVLGSFLENFALKLIITITLGIYWWVNGYSFVILFYIYVFALAFPGIISTLYLLSKGHFNFKIKKFKTKASSLYRDIATLGLFGLLGTLGGIVVLEVDRIMISNMLGLEHTAVYSIAFFFGLFCTVPAKALKRIASVVIAEAWEKGDVQTIKEVYHKSSLNLFLFGVYLFLGIWMNIDYVLQILPETYSNGKVVILIIGTAQLIDLITGVNTEIIGTSKHYKYITYFISILIVLVVISNFFLIPIYGINGAALASLLSIIVFNLMKFIFLYRVLNYQPLNYKFFFILLIAGLASTIVYYALPTFQNIYLGILITGSTLTVVYWIPVYLLKVSSDVNETIDKYLK